MFRLLPLACLACAVVALVAPALHAEPVPAKDRTVIMISIDGFPAWLWKDPQLPIPNLRRLAAQGSVAEGMTPSNPSITWINHTTLVTGVNPRKHGVLFNGLLVRNGLQKPPQIEPWRDKADLVRVPTLYDIAFQKGLKTAQVDWVAILNSGTITNEFLELPTPGGATERELVEAGTFTTREIMEFRKSPIAWRDHVWTQAAIHILNKHQPNLLLFHLLTTDSTNHTYGPGSSASFTAFGYADAKIGELIRAVEASGRADKTTYLVVTDHGFKKVRRIIDINVAMQQSGHIRLKDGKEVETCDAYAIAQGGLCFVYVTDPAKKAELLPKLKELCAKVEGVGQVLDGEQGPTLGMPTPAENQGMGDLILYAKPGYAFQKAPSWDTAVVDTKNYLGTHGYPASDPELQGVFFASGYGIKKGVEMGPITNLQVAPTAARLMGLTLPETEGKALEEILEPAALPAK